MVNSLEIDSVQLSFASRKILQSIYLKAETGRVIFTELIKGEKKNKGVIVTDHQYRSILGVSDDLYLLVNGTTYRATGDSDLVRFGYLPPAGEI